MKTTLKSYILLIIGLQATFSPKVCCASPEDFPCQPSLLTEAGQIIDKHGDTFITRHKSDALRAKLSILESQTDIGKSLKTAYKIEDPFYLSLALGGIAAAEISSSPKRSAKHFRDALIVAGNINKWTGSSPTSLGYLFELLPLYSKTDAVELLKDSAKAFYSWDGSAYQKSHALLNLSKATTQITPDAARDLLYSLALKSNHYWDSIEYLATFIARENMDKALELSEKHYTAQKDWPNDQYFRRAVLIELSKSNFDKAFTGIKEMRKLDQEIAAVKLLETLIEDGKFQNAEAVIAHIESLKSDFEWTNRSLNRLQKLLKNSEPPIDDDKATPKSIDRFLKNPSATELQSLANMQQVIFRDKQQIRSFLNTALPLVESIQDMGYPHHGSPKSNALGLLVTCLLLVNDIPEAIEVSKQIDIKEMRASSLIDAYEIAHPLSPIVSNWPIHFSKRRNILIE